MYEDEGLDYMDYERGVQVAGPSLPDLLGYDEEEDDTITKPETMPSDIKVYGVPVFPFK